MTGKRPPRTGLPALPPGLLGEIVQVVQFEIEDLRDAIHRMRRVTTCDREVRVEVGRIDLIGQCLCRDLLTEMLVEVDVFLRGRPPHELRNPPGAVRVHVRKRMVDWTRRRRVEQGAPARPERLRQGTLAASLPDDYHVALLHHLAAEAGSLAPLYDDAALVQRLAVLAAAEFGGDAAEHRTRVVAGVAVVEAACRRRTVTTPDAPGRTTWWERYIETPLGRRVRFDQPLPVADRDSPTGVDRFPAADRDDDGSVAVATVLRVVAASAEVDALALRHAADELVRTRQLSVAAAARFVADPGRVRIATEQARLLLPAA